MVSSEDPHLYSGVTASSPPEAVWLCNQPNLNATFPDVCGTSAAPSWFFLPVRERLPTTGSEHRSVWRPDNGTARFACGTQSRRVCARNTSITWQQPTQRAWLWALWRHHTQSDSADKIMMCDNMTAALPPHVENAALKHSILSQRAEVFPDVWIKHCDLQTGQWQDSSDMYF